MSRKLHLEIADRIDRILDITPDRRVGQLISFVSSLAREDSAEPVPIIEDEELLQALDDHLVRLRAWKATSQCVGSPE